MEIVSMRARGIALPDDVKEWYQALSRQDQQSAIAKLHELMHPLEYRLRVKQSPQMITIIANIVKFCERHAIPLQACKGYGECPVFKFPSAAIRNQVLIGIGIENGRAREKETYEHNSCTI